MKRKLSEALSLLWRNLVLFGAIIVTVAVPLNTVLELATRHLGEDSLVSAERLSAALTAIFSPVWTGALIFALWRLKNGQGVTYGEAMGVGLRRWAAVFAARFVAGLFVLVGLLALIVPGLVLAFRYALIDEVVVLEGASAADARARSTRLMSGRKLELLGLLLLCLCVYALAVGLGAIAGEFYKSLDLLPLKIALDCVVDVVGAVVEISVFLVYWEAVQKSAAAADLAEGDTPPPAPLPPTEWPGESQA